MGETVNCDGAYSCTGTRVVCPVGVDTITINCDADEANSCYNMRIDGDCDFTVNVDGCNDDDVKEAAGGTAYTGNYEYWCPSVYSGYGGIAAPESPSWPLKNHGNTHLKKHVVTSAPSDTVTVSSEVVVCVMALVIVLVTVNVTCLVMARTQRKAPKVDFV